MLGLRYCKVVRVREGVASFRGRSGYCHSAGCRKIAMACLKQQLWRLQGVKRTKEAKGHGLVQESFREQVAACSKGEISFRGLQDSGGRKIRER